MASVQTKDYIVQLMKEEILSCLLYTSDAADDALLV